jgi:putative phage-type endonuclease
MIDRKEIKLEQGSKEWLEYRKTRVGGSDLPAILGSSRYKKRHDLLADKLGQPEGFKGMNHLMRLGHEIEAAVRRDLYPAFRPAVFEHPENPRFFASLDGIDGDRILEVKSTQSKTVKDALSTAAIPLDWIDQIWWGLYCSGAKQGELCVVDSDTNQVITTALIEYPSEQWIESATAAASHFLIDLDIGKVARLGEVSLDPNSDLMKIDRITAIIQKAEARIKELKTIRENLAEGFLVMNMAESIECNGFRFGYRERKGPIEYHKIP